MDDFDTESNESGGSLRTKYEDLIKKVKVLETENVGFKAGALISDKGLKYVKPEDLAGVDPQELEKQALAIEERKTQERADVLRSWLEERGVPVDQLDDQLAQLLGDPNAEARSALSALSQAARLPGVPVKALQMEGMDSFSKIRAGVASKK